VPWFRLLFNNKRGSYLGFRLDGRLQQIRHVEAVEVTQRPRDFIPGFTVAHDFEEPHYLYTLAHVIRGADGEPELARAMTAAAESALDL
jgi:hypothetical protein